MPYSINNKKRTTTRVTLLLRKTLPNSTVKPFFFLRVVLCVSAKILLTKYFFIVNLIKLEVNV